MVDCIRKKNKGQSENQMWFINILIIIGAGLYLPTSLLLIRETTLMSFFSIFSSYNFLFQELSRSLILLFFPLSLSVSRFSYSLKCTKQPASIMPQILNILLMAGLHH